MKEKTIFKKSDFIPHSRMERQYEKIGRSLWFKRRRMRHALFFMLILFCMVSCASFKEVFKEQVLHQYPEKIALKCNAYSDTESELVTASEGRFKGRIRIGRITDSRPNQEYIAGVLSTTQYSAPIYSGGIFVIVPLGSKTETIKMRLEGKAEEILLTDVLKILKQNHYEVVANESNAEGKSPVMLDIELQEAWVASSMGPFSWTESRGIIRAKIVFRAALVEEGTGKVLWEQWFSGEETLKRSYFLARYHEEALAKAYCKSLESFKQTVDTPTFESAVNK